MTQNNIYDIAGRVKNNIAMEGLAISPAGTVLVNMHTHFLKKLYDFSETLEGLQRKQLQDLLRYEGEDVPVKILTVLTPQDEIAEEQAGEDE